MLNILLTGVGGQGTVLASRMIANAAIARGETAHTAETIGMAQRGGCVVSHVRIGEDAYSPLIPKHEADVIIGFEPGEAVRALPWLKRGGTMIVSSAAVQPVTDALGDSSYHGEDMVSFLKTRDARLILIDGAEVIRRCSAKVLNVALLGAAAKAGVIGVTSDELRAVIEHLNPKFRESNLQALELGESFVERRQQSC